MRRVLGSPLPGLLGCLLLLALWQATVPAFGVIAPAAVLRELAVDLLPDGDGDPGWLPPLAGTLSTALGGYLLGALAGLAVGALLAGGGVIAWLFRPLLGWLAVAPALAVAPLVLHWSRQSPWSAVLLAGWLALLPMARATAGGLAAVPRPWLEVMRGFAASPLQVLLVLRLPVAAAALFRGLKGALAAALAGAMVAEFLGAPEGLAGWVVHRLAAGATAAGLAGVLLLMLAGAGLAGALGWLERATVPSGGPDRRSAGAPLTPTASP